MGVAALAQFAMHRLDRAAERQIHIRADHRLAFAGKDCAFRQTVREVVDQQRGRANDRIVLIEIAEADRRRPGDPRIVGELVEHLSVHQRQGGGLQEDRGQHQLRLAARRPDDQVEPVGGTGGAEAQSPLLQRHRDAERDGERHDGDDEEGSEPEAADIGQDEPHHDDVSLSTASILPAVRRMSLSKRSVSAGSWETTTSVLFS